MILDLSQQEINIINKLVKRELCLTKGEVKLVKLFDLQNKLRDANKIEAPSTRELIIAAFERLGTSEITMIEIGDCDKAADSILGN